MSLTPAARRWSAIIDDYENSGQSLRVFARQRGLHPSTLGSWRSKLGRTAGPRSRATVFTELMVEPDEGAADGEGRAALSPSLVVRLGGRGAQVVVEHDTDLVLLRRVVEALC